MPVGVRILRVAFVLIAVGGLFVLLYGMSEATSVSVAVWGGTLAIVGAWFAALTGIVVDYYEQMNAI